MRRRRRRRGAVVASKDKNPTLRMWGKIKKQKIMTENKNGLKTHVPGRITRSGGK